MRTECPHCGQHYDVEQEYANQLVECSSCSQEFVVEIQPEQGNVVAPPPPEPSPMQEQTVYTQTQPQTNNSYNSAIFEQQNASSDLKALTCEMCGSTDMIKENGVFICQSCGTKYSLEEAKRMMIAGTVNVNVSSDCSLNYAKSLYEAKRYNDALDEVRKFLRQNASNLEAMEIEADIIQNYVDVFKAVPLQMKVIEKYSNEEIIERKVSSLIASIMNVHNATLKTYEKRFLANDADSLYSELMDIIEISASTIYSLDTIYSKLEQIRYDGTLYETIGTALCTVYKINNHPRWDIPNFSPLANIKKSYTWDIETKENMDMIFSKYESTYPVPKPEVAGKASCYIATAVYGSYDCPEVWTLRRFRDFRLGVSWYGRLFIKLYYFVSPTIVKYFGQTKLFQTFWRKKLDRLVKKLNNQGYSSLPYNDRNW